MTSGPFITLPGDFIPATGRDWDIARAALLFEADWACNYCDLPLSWRGSSIDHLVPRSQGGTDCFANLAICCPRCNSRKGARNLWEWSDPVDYHFHCEAEA